MHYYLNIYTCIYQVCSDPEDPEPQTECEVVMEQQCEDVVEEVWCHDMSSVTICHDMSRVTCDVRQVCETVARMECEGVEKEACTTMREQRCSPGTETVGATCHVYHVTCIMSRVF